MSLPLSMNFPKSGHQSTQIGITDMAKIQLKSDNNTHNGGFHSIFVSIIVFAFIRPITNMRRSSFAIAACASLVSGTRKS